ncbi:S-adenosyl-L-methionine-dependent methyltransferase [Clohesyomyces aquaticus]|uniref:S-adenosyl-L-methionine-dependent methyltransferase n=1 Tax=Clohesyomyces aquaticus TaxID=1231657 RepID=A0A1Y1YFN5_9PLEO|nr:S-adenosyl-L-methionine-dependent methyltransferase [Clohesyomyces aquaticus]
MTPKRASQALPRTGLVPLLIHLGIPGEIQMPHGKILPIGHGESTYRVVFRSPRSLRTPMTELGVGHAFVTGEIDIEGDISVLFAARTRLVDKVPLRQKLQFAFDFARTATSMNTKAIRQHYSYGDELYLTFIDKRFRFYSQGLFQSPNETIEEASEHKLESMFTGLGLRPGMRLLDIGGGWGGVTEYCGSRGVHVTTLTIAPDSAAYVQRLIDDNDYPGVVFLEDFLNHCPAKPYDHAVIYGVIEHIPNYRGFSKRIWPMLKPGGRLYLDASAAVEKYDVSGFSRDFIWRGTHTFMTLQDVTAELLYHGFEILEICRETKDYELTMLEWAKRLDAAKDEVVARWGEETYRIFRLFLWGGTHAFKTNALQAYHLLAERTSDPGPRPSIPRRTLQFVGSLR